MKYELYLDKAMLFYKISDICFCLKMERHIVHVTRYYALYFFKSCRLRFSCILNDTYEYNFNFKQIELHKVTDKA